MPIRTGVVLKLFSRALHSEAPSTWLLAAAVSVRFLLLRDLMVESAIVTSHPIGSPRGSEWLCALAFLPQVKPDGWVFCPEKSLNLGYIFPRRGATGISVPTSSGHGLRLPIRPRSNCLALFASVEIRERLLRRAGNCLPLLQRGEEAVRQPVHRYSKRGLQQPASRQLIPLAP